MRFIFPGSACSIRRPRFFNKTAPLILPSTPASALFMFMLMPVFIIIITCIISSSMKKNFPGTYFVLSGGRGR